VRSRASSRPIHLLIDSTGLRIHVGNLGKPPKNRAWRKLHLAVDAHTCEIIASDLTSRRTSDYIRVPALLGQIDNRVTSVSADGAYDTEGVYEAAHAQGEGRAMSVLILPRRDAQLSPRPSAAMKERIGISAPSADLADVSGTSGRASANGAWSRPQSTGTRQSSVDA